MAPILILGEKKHRLRTVLLVSIVFLVIAEGIFTSATSISVIASALVIYFVGFNLLEALQPSLVSRFAKESKGAALGVYNTTQSIGLFSGAVLGGYLMDSLGAFLGLFGWCWPLNWLAYNCLVDAGVARQIR